MNYIETLTKSLNLGFPIIAVETSDYSDTTNAIINAVGKDRSVLHWDLSRGVIGLNDSGCEAASQMNDGEDPAIATAQLADALYKALHAMPGDSVLIMDDVHSLLEHNDPAMRALFIQCLRNCRDPFKSTSRAIVILCPSIKLPVELKNDVEIIECPLPDEAAIRKIAVDITGAAGLLPPTEEDLARVADAMLGLSAFAAENAMVKCLTKTGFDFPALWEKKKAHIRQVSALSVPNTVSTFDQLGGLDAIKEYGRDIINGKRRPRLVVLLDELDKWIASLGDSNGINADCLGQLLGAMQDNDWDGITLPGFAGTGKTEWAKSLGNEAGGMFLQMDLGGAKGGIVGDSERMIRQALSMIKAMGGDRVMFVATCNDMSILQRKPELLRRLAYGIHFFDLPTEEEQAPIWDLYLKKYDLPKQELPPCDGWTGAEIKKVCKLADEFGKPLTAVAGRITPVCRTMGEGVDRLRTEAAKGGWISAKSGHPYAQKKSLSPSKVRSIQQ